MAVNESSSRDFQKYFSIMSAIVKHQSIFQENYLLWQEAILAEIMQSNDLKIFWKFCSMTGYKRPIRLAIWTQYEPQLCNLTSNNQF